MSVEITVVPYGHPDAVALIAELQQEFVTRYGEPDHTPVDPADFAPPAGLFLVGYLDGVPVGCGGWRAHDREAELKRMYVAPAARGKGLARAILAELERTALAASLETMILVTGSKQPEAVTLYESAGYQVVPGFGYYADVSDAIHLGKPLVVEEATCPSTR